MSSEEITPYVPSCPDLTNSLKNCQLYPETNFSNISHNRTEICNPVQAVSNNSYAICNPVQAVSNNSYAICNPVQAVSHNSEAVMEPESQFINGIQKYAVSNKTLSFDNDSNKCCIPHHGDLCTFKYICIKQSKNVIPQLESFSLYIGDTCIITYYVDLLKEIVKDFITIKKNTILYKFPNEMAYEPIRLISLFNQNVYIKLNFVNNDQASNILEKLLCVQFSSLNIESRRNMKISSHNDNIFQIYKSSCKSSYKTNMLSHILPLKGLTNGFVIICDHIENIKNIKLLKNNRELLSYDNTEIFMFTKRYNDTALYLTLTDSDDVFRKDFDCSLNMDHDTKIEIQFIEPADKLYIYTMMPNILKYENGMPYIISNNNSMIEHEFGTVQPNTILNNYVGFNPELNYYGSNIVLNDHFQINKRYNQRYNQGYNSSNIALNDYLNNNKKCTAIALFNPFSNTILSRQALSYKLDNMKEICKEYTGNCKISSIAIRKNDKYMECGICKQCFHKKPLIERLNINKICPLCKKEWTNMIVYINKDESSIVVSLYKQLKSYIPYDKSQIASLFKQLKSYFI
uniref:Ring finger protein n=1 Tax=Mimivirus LCMiAC01 TaxID=2506608 RepID=A0A481Z0J2_9VIRU|nr:MAG: ring finger protein [Mimivirus LCMiAC01]